MYTYNLRTDLTKALLNWPDIFSLQHKGHNCTLGISIIFEISSSAYFVNEMEKIEYLFYFFCFIRQLTHHKNNFKYRPISLIPYIIIIIIMMPCP